MVRTARPCSTGARTHIISAPPLNCVLKNFYPEYYCKEEDRNSSHSSQSRLRFYPGRGRLPVFLTPLNPLLQKLCSRHSGPTGLGVEALLQAWQATTWGTNLPLQRTFYTRMGKLTRPGVTISLKYLLVEEGYHFRRKQGTPGSGSSAQRFCSVGRGRLSGQSTTHSYAQGTDSIWNSVWRMPCLMKLSKTMEILVKSH